MINEVTTETEEIGSEESMELGGIIFERLTVLLPRDMKKWLMNPAKHNGEKGSTVIRLLCSERMIADGTIQLSKSGAQTYGS